MCNLILVNYYLICNHEVLTRVEETDLNCLNMKLDLCVCLEHCNILIQFRDKTHVCVLDRTQPVVPRSFNLEIELTCAFLNL